MTKDEAFILMQHLYVVLQKTKIRTAEYERLIKEIRKLADFVNRK